MGQRNRTIASGTDGTGTLPTSDHLTTHEQPSSGRFSGPGRATSKRSLWIALSFVSVYLVAEIIGGLIANSLALLADAGHMVTDAAAIGLALVAMWVAGRPASARRTFGFHRVEILTALLNALTLWLIAAWIFFEAFQRFLDPPEVRGTLTLAVGVGGLVVNIGAVWILKRAAGESLNVEGAFWHVVGDLLGPSGWWRPLFSLSPLAGTWRTRSSGSS